MGFLPFYSSFANAKFELISPFCLLFFLQELADSDVHSTEKSKSPDEAFYSLQENYEKLIEENRQILQEKEKIREEKEAAAQKHHETKALMQSLMAELEEARKRQGTPMPSSASVAIGSLQPSRGSSTAVSPAGSGFMPLSARSSRKGSPGFGSDWFGEDR